MTATMITVGNVCYMLLAGGYICFSSPSMQTLPPTPSKLDCADVKTANVLSIITCKDVIK